MIIPPLISQFLNLTKNSSLAGAIGYSDLFNVSKTMTQTAPAISIILLVMAAYLAMSLTYSLIGNLYNRHIRFHPGADDGCRSNPPAEARRTVPGGSRPSVSRRPAPRSGPSAGPRENLFGSWLQQFADGYFRGHHRGNPVLWAALDNRRGGLDHHPCAGAGQMVIGQFNTESGLPRPELLLAAAGGAVMLVSAALGMAWVIAGGGVAKRLAIGVGDGGHRCSPSCPTASSAWGSDVRLLLAANIPALAVGWVIARYSNMGVRGIIIYVVVAFILTIILLRGIEGVPVDATGGRSPPGAA